MSVTVVNSVSVQDGRKLLEKMRTKGALFTTEVENEDPLVWKTNMSANSKGYVQFNLQTPSGQVKVLAHQLILREQKNWALLDETLTASHRHPDKKVLIMTEEDTEWNESRKMCHSKGWWAPLAADAARGFHRARCPHIEAPCRGPHDARHV